ncbi:MAG: AAA family ATPase, partial [Pseudomonadales bacterium]
LKKPVHFNFIDFSTLTKREHFCREELRCNRAFAADLYLDVVPVVDTDTTVRLIRGAGGSEQVVEWAVMMRQFDPDQGLDRLLGRGELKAEMLRSFGATLAALHEKLPRHAGSAAEVPIRVFGPVEDSFTEIGNTGLGERHRSLLADVIASARSIGSTLRKEFDARMVGGWIRECHGDLHLSNLALIGPATEAEVTAFDCLEFNANLRWIDTMSDVAFLFMDCRVRGEPGLAYGFLDGYLDASGDYDGVRLLHYFAAYRSVVRAKVAALRWVQESDDATAERFLEHLLWARDWLNRPPGMLVLTCGLSGSGKSYLAEKLATAMPAVRLRSDVARKKLAGLVAGARSHSPIDGGLYDTEQSDRTFAYLAELTQALLLAGENVIVDATFIERSRRTRFFDLAAALGCRVRLIYCEAPLEVLRERLQARAISAEDPSEATQAVLDLQLERLESPLPDERALHLDMAAPLTEPVIADLIDVLGTDGRWK